VSQSDFPTGQFSDFNPTAQRLDPYGSPQSPPRRSSSGCWLWAILLGGGFLLLVCCGGGALLVGFGLQIVTTEIEDQLSGNPILQEHVGEVQSFEMDWSRSFADEDDDTFIYQVQGTKGEGRVTVKHITDDDGNEVILSAQLRLPNGETVDLMPGQEDGPWQ
jgi:hypothetical protein